MLCLGVGIEVVETDDPLVTEVKCKVVLSDEDRYLVVPVERIDDICVTMFVFDIVLCIIDGKVVLNDEDRDLVVPVERIDDICVTMFVFDIVLCIIDGKVVIPIDFTEIGAFELLGFVDIGALVLFDFVDIGALELLGFVDIGAIELLDFVNVIFFNSVFIGHLDVFVLFLNFIS